MKNLIIASLLLTTAGFADSYRLETTPNLQYHNRMAVFGPFHQCYERIKPESVYAGVDIYATDAVTTEGKWRAILNGEFRMGYNFFWNGKDHLTPIAGIGVFKDFTKHHHYVNFDHKTEQRPPIIYAALGLMYDHEFNSVVNLGINAKFLVGGSPNHSYINWGSPDVGVDASLPLTFRFGYKRHWDFRFEPFTTYFHGEYFTENYFGFRSTIGYRF